MITPKSTATLIGFIAVLLWSLLALFTAASGNVPPFQLAAMTFTIGAIAGASTWIFRPQAIGVLRQSWKVWAVGVGGLFGYHFMYFSALRAAPTVDASLIAYLWPLLIVLFSAFGPGEKLRANHVLGAGIGFVGALTIISGGNGFDFKNEYATGYAMALVAALIWTAYSLASRRFANIPTDIVTGFCGATAILAMGCHLALEQTVWPINTSQWLAIVGLGLGPVGLAFYVWDFGVKHGNIQVLGALAYCAPLLSTLVLIATGVSKFTWPIAIACLLITLGAAIAAIKTSDDK